MELVLIIVVAAVVMPPLMGVFAETAHKSARPDSQQVALALAREKLEILTADRFNPARGYDYLVAGNYPAENPVGGFLASRSVAFTDVAAADLSTASSGSGYRKAVITVTWDGGKGRLVLIGLFTEY